MSIDPALDKWVWIGAAAFLVLLGARAWVVETGQRQLGGTPTKVRAFTVGAGVLLAVVTVLFMSQAGALLVRSLVTGTDPISLLGGTDNQPVPNGQGEQVAPDGQQAPAGQAPAGQAPADQPAPDGAAPVAPAGG